MADVLHTHLRVLEDEAIHIIREALAQFERAAILFSGGKDSVVLAWLARKAVSPAKLTVPLLHIDTGHNFPETLRFRDAFARELNVPLLVRLVQDTIDRGRAADETGVRATRNALQTVTLLDAIQELRLDAALGGARRDEEKARAKERIFSHRNAFGEWEPKQQRPELWGLYNGRKNAGEHFRVFPLSNWTELDVWQYVAREHIQLPELYFAHDREVFERDGMLLAVSDHVRLDTDERPVRRRVRFRTIGDATCTGALCSDAATTHQVVAEIAAARVTERGGRADDRRSETSMEDRKRQGYF
ncbi:MAG: sulfate adenylyltransferase subunit 2 [Cyanobacteria bacterium]|nr:sulfate adenylyltransferase subunit 2 [Cyanobacteriota bacterium]